MKDWRSDLNQLATDFWFGVGDVECLSAWADIANSESGEVHDKVWALYPPVNYKDASEAILEIARDVNRFSPTERNAEIYAKQSLSKALLLFLCESISSKELCILVQELDMTFNILLGPDKDIPTATNRCWLGNLWDICDWRESEEENKLREELANEARILLEELSKDAQPGVQADRP